MPLLAAMLKILSGDQSLFGGPVLDAEDSARARADQINALCRYTRGMMVVNIVSAIVFVTAGLQTPYGDMAMAWSFCLVVVAAFFYLKATRQRVAVTQMSARTVRRAVRNACLLGCFWALLPLFFFDDGAKALQLVVICLCVGFLCGGAFVLASIPIAAIAFMSPIVAALAYVFLSRGDSVYYLIALLLVMYLFVLVRAVMSHGHEMLDRLVDKYAAQREAKEDPLTKLPNRLALQARIEEASARFSRFGEPYAVLYLDLDKFKDVNDELGHFAGDQMLLQVAERLNACVRDSDSVARLGGDEFAILCLGITTPKAAVMLADRILKAFSVPFIVEGSRRMSATSIGIALAPSDGNEAHVLLRKADAALYRAKRDGRGTFCFFEETDDASVSDRRMLEKDLRAAIGSDEIFLEFQPFLNLATDAIVGFEALVRWKHPERGMIGPAVFIPVAEEAGLMQELGEHILLAACSEAATWPSSLRIAVNFSVMQFRSESIAEVIRKTLAKTGLAANRLEIEITESVFLARAERAVEILEGLSSAGIQISLDDFGTGYSSLTSLRRLPLTRLKIDRSFVMDAASDAECASIVRAVLGLAANMQLSVTAEGVETAEQLAFLRENNCEEVQGYLVSRPMSAEAARALALGHSSIAVAA